MLKDNDPVNHPNHYTSHPSGIECIQITEHMDFNLGNALKYIWRADLKHDAIEDLNKALFYINRELNRRQHWTAGEDGENKAAYVNEAEQVEQIRSIEYGPAGLIGDSGERRFSPGEPSGRMSLEDCADIARAMGVHI